MKYLSAPKTLSLTETSETSKFFDSPLRQTLLFTALLMLGFAGLYTLLCSQYGWIVAWAVILFSLYQTLLNKGSSSPRMAMVPVEPEPQTIIHHHHYNLHYHTDKPKNTGYVRSEEIRND